MTAEQAATLKRLAQAAYELDTFNPNLTFLVGLVVHHRALLRRPRQQFKQLGDKLLVHSLGALTLGNVFLNTLITIQGSASLKISLRICSPGHVIGS